MLGGYLSDSEVIKKMSYLVCCLFILAQPSLSSYGAQLWSCAYGPLIIMSQQHSQSGLQWTESSEALSVMFQTVVLLTFSACVCHWHTGSHSSWKALPFMSKLFKGNVPTYLKARESGWEGGVCPHLQTHCVLGMPAGLFSFAPHKGRSLLLFLRSWRKSVCL